MKLHRLPGRKTSERVLKKGNVWRGKTMTIRWVRGIPLNFEKPKEGVYIGTAASTRLHKSAVKRNRMRRRCREALRTALLKRSKMPSLQLLVSPRSRSLTCDFSDIQEDVASFLSQFSHG